MPHDPRHSDEAARHIRQHLPPWTKKGEKVDVLPNKPHGDVWCAFTVIKEAAAKPTTGVVEGVEIIRDKESGLHAVVKVLLIANNQLVSIPLQDNRLAFSHRKIDLSLLCVLAGH